MTERNTVVLRFENDIGSAMQLTIPRADMTLTAVQVQTTMEAMITGGIIFQNGGFPDAIKGAELITTQRAPLVV